MVAGPIRLLVTGYRYNWSALRGGLQLQYLLAEFGTLANVSLHWSALDAERQMEKAALAVIVAEDYEGLRYALTAHLRHAGFEVIEAIDDVDALQKARDDSGSIDIPVRT